MQAPKKTPALPLKGKSRTKNKIGRKAQTKNPPPVGSQKLVSGGQGGEVMKTPPEANRGRRAPEMGVHPLLKRWTQTSLWNLNNPEEEWDLPF